jgi:putative flippase GtrA
LSFKQLVLRFFAAGGSGVLLYYGVLYGLTTAGLWYIHSSIVGRVASFGLVFVLQKFWTFRNHERKTIRRQLALFLLLEVAFFGINTWNLYRLVSDWGLHYLAAQAILTTLLSIVSFILKRKIFT